MKKYICLLLTVTFIACVDNSNLPKTKTKDEIKNHTCFVLDLDNLGDPLVINTSSLFRPIETILLESPNQVAVKHPLHIASVEDRLAIFYWQGSARGLFICDRMGSVVTNIDPVENSQKVADVKSLTIDKDKKELIALDGNQLKKYDLRSGKFISQSVLDSVGNSYHLKHALLHNNRLFLGVYPYQDMAQRDSVGMLREYHKNSGKFITSHLNGEKYNLLEEAPIQDMRDPFYEKGSKNPKYIRQRMDTMMYFSKGELKPYLTVNSSRFLKKDGVYTADTFDCIKLLFDNDVYCAISYSGPNTRTYTAIYDKKKKQTRELVLQNDLLLQMENGKPVKHFSYAMDVMYEDERGVYVVIPPSYLSLLDLDAVSPQLHRLDELKERLALPKVSAIILFYPYL